MGLPSTPSGRSKKEVTVVFVPPRRLFLPVITSLFLCYIVVSLSGVRTEDRPRCLRRGRLGSRGKRNVKEVPGELPRGHSGRYNLSTFLNPVFISSCG